MQYQALEPLVDERESLTWYNQPGTTRKKSFVRASSKILLTHYSVHTGGGLADLTKFSSTEYRARSVSKIIARDFGNV